MARLTIAGLTATLAAQGISLTKTAKGYTVVMIDGYSETHSTLANVQSFVEANVDRGITEEQCKEVDERRKAQDASPQYWASISQDGSIDAYDSYFAEVERQNAQQLADDLAFDAAIDCEGGTCDNTAFEEAEALLEAEAVDESVQLAEVKRKHQLFEYANEAGLLPIKTLTPLSSLSEDVAALEHLLVNSAKTGRHRRAPLQHHREQYSKGFGKIVHHSRCDTKLLRRSDKFLASLSLA